MGNALEVFVIWGLIVRPGIFHICIIVVGLQRRKETLHLVLSLFAVVLPFINLLNFNLWSRFFNRFGPINIILLMFAVFARSGAAVVENLVFCKNLVFWHVNLLISFIIGGSIFVILYDWLPISNVRVHQVLNFKPGSHLKQVFIISQLENLEANGVTIIEIDDFILAFGTGWLRGGIIWRKVILRLSAKFNHKLVHHVADNFDVLIIQFLLQIIQARFYDVSIELPSDEKLGKQVHVAVHLFLFTLLKFFVIIQIHHLLRKILLIVGVFCGGLSFSRSSRWILLLSFKHRQRISSLFPLLTLLVKHLEELFLTLRNKQFLEIHLVVFGVVELLE